MRVAIVIPVYRAPNEWEEVSLRQCCKVLSHYDHYIVAPEGLDLSAFYDLWTEYGLTLHEERFDTAYFKGIKGYNSLCLSRGFYARFAEMGYAYMLIYQPDVFVFADQLEEWCIAGYEYVAPPNVGLAKEKTYRSNMPLRVGVGGFSLRSTDAFLRFFDGKKSVFSLWQVLTTPSHWKRNNWWILAQALQLWYRGNTPQGVLSHWRENEDDMWSGLLSMSRYALRKPSAEEALRFGFDRFPKEMYDRTTHRLPMGCHAWHKYEYDEFWKEIIHQYTNS